MTWFWRHAPEAGVTSRIAGLFSFFTQCQPVLKEGLVAHCEVGEMFARRLGLPEAVQQAVRFSWERWDGKGMAYGLKGHDIPLAARALHLAQVAQVSHALGGRGAAEAMVRERRGADFDPDLAGSFLQVCGSDQFWDLVELPTAQPEILAMRPPSSYDALSSEGTDTVCEVLADFADVKSRTTWNHSLAVADVTTQLATAVGIAPAGAAKRRGA
ncbi:MAG: HD domain-containing phosphohydrolase, partial [Chloroflexota bacterium]